MPKKIFEVFILFWWCLWSLSGVFGVDELKSVSVTEGESVTLNSDTEIQTDDLIMWRTGHNNILIAKIKENNYKTDFPDERFRDRLKLDEKTASLTIMNIRTTDSGLYRVTSSRSKTPLNTFNLTVYARLPVPVISHSSKKSPSSLSNCSLVCSSVLNVSDATLSWYAGISVLSSISVCDLSISLSLPLEIQCLDDSYSCVLNNTISNQTTHVNTQLCGPCSDFNCCCGFTEAVIRLALSALVGVATAAVLVYEFRSRSLQQKKREQTPSNSD
ncbi:uncharacterized protein LOC130071876 [Rhinichthys klamathensis goyatoka]|uniref:uncharacterized protein LOC130071876 n=1 Tax=Rhinichthys klamathensis goyatoka TaxID=3034132 RepID=UPI0024B4C177|nr:uncharacterized protein LOC130071876 [Rhinichthys klamathensis goyatoka]